MLFNKEIRLEDLNKMSEDTLASHLGIEFIEAGPDYLKARMPVDKRTFQPLRMLHGGASLALAETLGSVCSNILIDRNRNYCVGMEINANHIRPVSSGWVYGTAKKIHLGQKTHIWEIRIRDEKDHLVCISRLTVAIIDKKQ
jgi:1,4-dihydroxy-2-naphthoyl-CoA hydrolase